MFTKLITFNLVIVFGLIYLKCTDPVSKPEMTYSITYDGNGNGGGDVPIDTSNYVTGAIVTVLGNVGNLIKTSYIFDGWNTNADGNGHDYTPGDTLSISSNIVLYAKWIVNTVTDIDGNVYQTVRIGNQVWISENFRTTRFNDGSEIPLVTDNTEWDNLTTPGYCYMHNDSAAYAVKYGVLYNWHTVNTKKLTPIGWHVPTHAEWDTLINYLIANGYNWDSTTTGNKIAKSLAAKVEWQDTTIPGAIGNDLTKNNRSGFSALPSGGRHHQGGNFSIVNGFECLWWCSTEEDFNPKNAYVLWLINRDVDVFNNIMIAKNCGLSIRLVKD